MKIRKTLSALILYTCLILIAALCTWILITPQPAAHPGSTGPAGPDAYKSLLAQTLHDYLSTIKGQGDWWLATELPPGSEAARVTAERLRDVYRAVELSKGASDLATKIGGSFHGFIASIYTHGQSMITQKGEFGPDDLKDKLEVCFIPHSEFAQSQLPSSLYFNQTWNAVMVAGKTWPETFFCGILMHELGHAYRYKEAPSRNQDANQYAVEEIEMHQLESDVFDFRTAGAYSAAIKKVIAKHGSARSSEELLSLLTTADLLLLDTAIGVEHSGPAIRSISVGEHLVMVGIRFIDRKHSDMAEKVRLYRWVLQQS